MSFIAKNPIILPEIKHTPSTPPGTRGIFAKEDGWYDIDSDGTVTKLAQSGDTPGGGDSPSDKDIQELIEELNDLKEKVEQLYAKSLVKIATITLLSSEWITDGDNHHSQIITIAGITQYSKVDLQPTPEQLTIFHEKDITFVTENDDGVITVYCIGQKPLNDYVIQATITEVEIDG